MQREPSSIVRDAAVAVVVLLLVATSTVVTATTEGIFRAGMVVLVVVLYEVRSVALRLASLVVAFLAALAVLGATAEALVVSGLRLVEVLALVGVLVLAPARAGRDAGPGHRFVVTTIWLALVVVVGGVVETWLFTASGAWTDTFALSFARTAIPLAIAAFLASVIVARPRLDDPRRTGLAMLAGPFAVMLLVLAAAEVTLRYWEADDESTLGVAAETATAAMQQAVAADVDAFLARAGTAPRLPWTSMEQFALTMQPFINGNASVSAVSLLVSGPEGTSAPFVLSRQGETPALAAVMGADPADASSIQQVADTGALQLLGVRDIPAADGQPEPHLVFVAPQTLASPPPDPTLLSMGVSVPVALQEGEAALGPLGDDVVLEVRELSSDGSTTLLATVAGEDASRDSSSEYATSTASLGTVTLEVRAIATDQLGPSFTVRATVLGGLALFGLVALVLVLQAANARFRSQRALEEREALLATAIDAAPGLVALVDADGMVRMANGGTDQRSTIMVDQHVGNVLPFVMQAADRERFGELLATCVAGEQGSMEVVDMASEEALRIYLVTAAPVPTTGRGSVRALVQVQDVTEQRARAVRGAQAQRLQALGTMAGGLAHDFNNLLFIISGYLQMLEEDDRVSSQPDLVRYVERAVDAAGRGTEIASSLLAVSRSQPLQATDVEVGAFVRDMMPLVKQAVGRERSVTLDVAPGAHGARVDSGQLSSAVLNLVINSRDATQPGGTVEVVVGRRSIDAGELDLPGGDYVVIEVRDDGTGMTPEVGARAFEPFFSTKSTGNGTGLGLTAVYSFASQSGGVAAITTEPERGTTVSLLLPRIDVDALVDEPAPVEEERRLDGARRVLVVDDESALAGLVAAWVSETGAEVRVANAPMDALELVESFRPDVLLTDIRLGDPEIDGIELAARAVPMLPDVVVVLMTGYSDRMQEAQLVGTRVLAKPFTKDELHRVLAETADLAGAEAAR